jgi:hypothetical protein
VLPERDSIPKPDEEMLAPDQLQFVVAGGADGIFAPAVRGDPGLLPITGRPRPDPQLFHPGVGGCSFASYFVADPGTDWGYLIDDFGVSYSPVSGDPRVFVPPPPASPAPCRATAEEPRSVRDQARAHDERTRRAFLRLGVDTTYESASNQYVLFEEEDACAGDAGPVRYRAMLHVTADASRRLVVHVSLEFAPEPRESWVAAGSRDNPGEERRPEWPLVAEALARLQRWHNGERRHRDAGGRVITAYERWCRQVSMRVPAGTCGDGIIAAYGVALLQQHGPVPPPFGR